MDPDTSPDTPQGFRLASDATGLTLHIPPLPDPPEIALFLTVAGVALFLLLSIIHYRRKWKAIGSWLAKRWRDLKSLIQRHYLTPLILFGILAIGWAVYNYLWQVPELIGKMLHRLTEVLDKNNPSTSDIRNIGYTFAALAGMLAILATIPFQLVRVWINERTAKTQEANLTTGLINTAVEGLGAEKKVSRIGRPVTFTKEGEPAHTAIEWQRGDPPSPPDIAWELAKRGDWQTFDQTEPNLEVRIGAILTLDRIARENPGEHIRVMDILCAYIRENAPASDAKDHPFDPWPDYPKNPTAEQLEAHRIMLDRRAKYLRNWIDKLPEPRTDIQTALTTIGNRDPERIAQEEARYTRGGETGYRLDLRETNLRKYDLSHLNLNRARLDGARMEGANLAEALINDASLIVARMEGASMPGAHLTRTQASHSTLERTNLSGACMEEADLGSSRLEGAFLIRAQMQGAVLDSARMAFTHLSGAEMQGVWSRGADLRGVRGLTQSQLDQMIGNEMTLLPDTPAPDTNRRYSVPSCWKEPPAALVRRGYDWEADLRGYRCPSGQEPARTGRPWPLDAPYPEGHPLANRDKTG